MRVGIVSLQHETNTFIRELTCLDAFRGGLLAEGDAFRAAVEHFNHELAGFFAGLDDAGATAVPLFGARALPYGLMSADAYGELKRRLLAAVEAHLPLDGLLAAPHGAGVSEAARDLDGDWLQAVRALVGPAVPIRCIVAKGVNAPLAAYREVCASIIRVDTPGSTAAAPCTPSNPACTGRRSVVRTSGATVSRRPPRMRSRSVCRG